MLLGEVNFIVLIFFIFFSSLVINVNTSVHLLLTAEFLWITLYVLSLIVGLTFNDINVISLTFFFLILSAVEFGVGLVIILHQHIFNRSINLNDNPYNSVKFLSRFFNKLNLSNYKFA